MNQDTLPGGNAGCCVAFDIIIPLLEKAYRRDGSGGYKYLVQSYS